MRTDAHRAPLRDGSGRCIRYLRLSVTRACPLRCVYCRPAGERGAQGGAAELTAGECADLVGYLVARHGLRKVRLTGGEPTCRPDLLEIIGRLRRIHGLRELALTTNGLTLASAARALAQAGLQRVNISLDSLDPRRFARLTGAAAGPQVISGIEASVRAGLTPVKLNTVVLRGFNDTELPALLSFAAGRGLEIRFIELMPMGLLAADWTERFVPRREMRARLSGVVTEWQPLARCGRADRSASSSATRFRVRLRDGRRATVGFIAAMSCPFCARCDRVRVTADGTLFPCLMDAPAVSLLQALRPRLDAVRLDQLFMEALSAKPASHPAAGPSLMSSIGG